MLYIIGILIGLGVGSGLTALVLFGHLLKSLRKAHKTRPKSIDFWK